MSAIKLDQIDHKVLEILQHHIVQGRCIYTQPIRKDTGINTPEIILIGNIVSNCWIHGQNWSSTTNTRLHHCTNFGETAHMQFLTAIFAHCRASQSFGQMAA